MNTISNVEGRESREISGPHKGAAWWARTISYWVFTGLVSFEMIAGSLWDLLKIEFTRVNMAHLGYPLYFTTITGIWKLPAGIVMLVPRFQRVKEWAYAGMIFTYTGAIASHLFVGDRTAKWSMPLALALVTLGSWALRRPERTLAKPLVTPTERPKHWIIPTAVAAAFFVLALLTLPKGAPPP